MEFKVITDLEEAKHIWNTLSPHKTIDDEWDFRYTFIKNLPYKLHFITAFDENAPVALLPLQRNNLEGLMPPYFPQDNREFLEFFGGDDTDDNTVLSLPEKKLSIQDFTSQIDIPAYLAPLEPSYQSDPNAVFYETKYFLNVENYKTHEDFLLEKWSSSSKKTFLKQIRKLYRDHKIEVIENNYEDIDLLASFNVQRFGEKSSFSYDYRKEIFKDLTKLYDVVMLTLVVDGVKSAVSYGIHYKDVYVGMNAGVSSSIADLPKLLIMLQIDKTIQLGCKVYDAGKGDSGWKEMYKLDKIPQFKLTIIP